MKSQGAFRLCLSYPPQKAEKYQNSPKIFRPTLFQQTSCKSTAKSAKICWKHRIRCSAKLSLVKREREGESIIRKQQLFSIFKPASLQLCTALHCFVHCSALLGGECRWSSSCHKHHSCSLSFPSSCLLLTPTDCWLHLATQLHWSENATNTNWCTAVQIVAMHCKNSWALLYLCIAHWAP